MNNAYTFYDTSLTSCKRGIIIFARNPSLPLSRSALFRCSMSRSIAVSNMALCIGLSWRACIEKVCEDKVRKWLATSSQVQNPSCKANPPTRGTKNLCILVREAEFDQLCVPAFSWPWGKWCSNIGHEGFPSFSRFKLLVRPMCGI